jgi:hypothetical protein
MEAAELGRLWAEYYRKRHTDPDALQICVSVSKIVKGKAHLLVGSSAVILTRILNEAGIPMEEYDQFELESMTK